MEEEKSRDWADQVEEEEEEEEQEKPEESEDGSKRDKMDRKQGTAEEVKKEATKKLAEEKVCKTAGCKNPVYKYVYGFECPECKTLGIQGSFFCSQDCFNSSWTLHTQVHKDWTAQVNQLTLANYLNTPLWGCMSSDY